MEDLDHRKFQEAVSQSLIRHKSVLDVLTKLQEATARVNRAVAKSVTNCGCIRINAAHQYFPPNLASYSELRNFTKTHLEGELCDNCREVVETELGQTLFYLAALCDLCNLDLNEVMEKEFSRVSTLGTFNLT